MNDQEYNTEAAVLFNILNFKMYRQEILEQCDEVDFTSPARPLFVSLCKAYNNDIIDNQDFKTQFFNDHNEFLSMSKSKAWPQVKTDFFDRSIRRLGKQKAQILLMMFEEPDIPMKDIKSIATDLNEIVNDSRMIKRPIKKLKHILNQSIDHMQRIINDDFKFIKWGIDLLDEECQAEAQDLNIIAARPGIGKTIVAHNCIIGASDYHPVAYWCGEMSDPVIGLRLLSILTGILHEDIRKPKRLTTQQLQVIYDAVKTAINRNIYISTNTGDTVEDIGSWMKQLVEYHGVKHVFIDYMQRIRPSNSKAIRRDQVLHMSNRLKDYAAELNITVTALAQLNRECVGIEPQISHLAECSHIEQDASTIVLLDRIKIGENMGKRNYKYRVPGSNRLEDCNGSDLLDSMIFSVAKSRHGAERLIYAECDLETLKIGGRTRFTGDFSKRTGQ